MTNGDAVKIIQEEGLKFYNWFDQNNLRENEVCIKQVDNMFFVYMTTERAGIFDSSVANFKNESDALQDFIERLRLMNKFY